jgi:hypothetical protein
MRDFLVSESLKRLSQVPMTDGSWVTQRCSPAGRTSQRELPLRSECSAFDEVLIADARASLRPAQLVERKLMGLLKSIYLPVSHVRTTALYNGRGPNSVPASPAGPTLRVSSKGRGRAKGPEHDSPAAAPLYCPS